jgi:DNA replication protein DnaC
MATESPTVMTTAESTTPSDQSNPLREHWEGLTQSEQFVIEQAAKQYVFGEYDHKNEKYFFRMVTDGFRERKPTVLEVMESVFFKPYLPRENRDMVVAQVQRIAASMRRVQVEIRLRELFKHYPRHSTCRLTNYIATTDGQRTALAAIVKFCDEIEIHVAAGDGIVFNGTVGSGKTHLLFGAACRATMCGFSVVYRNVQHLLSEFRSRIGYDDAPSEASMIKRLVEAEILILDDVVTPHGEFTAYQEQLLYNISEGRYSKMRPTWIGMNVSGGDEAVKRVGAAVVDRWKDGALCLAFDWESHRKAMQK